MIEIERLQAAVDILVTEKRTYEAEIKRLEDRWNDIAHERNDLKREIERLQEELTAWKQWSLDRTPTTATPPGSAAG